MNHPFSSSRGRSAAGFATVGALLLRGVLGLAAAVLALSLLLAGALALTAVAAWALLSGRRSRVAGVWQRWRERAQHVARAGNRVRPPWMREGSLASRAAARDVTDVVPREVRPARGGP